MEYKVIYVEELEVDYEIVFWEVEKDDFEEKINKSLKLI